jgi:hypothetical protein
MMIEDGWRITMDELSVPAVLFVSIECRLQVGKDRRWCCPEIEGGDRDDRLGDAENTMDERGRGGCASRTKELESTGPSSCAQDWKSSLDAGKVNGGREEWVTRKNWIE